MWFDIFIGILLNLLQVEFNQEDIIKCDKNISCLMYIETSITSVTMPYGAEIILMQNLA